ncbi:DUF6551 family protein [Actinomadura litoris]|uniref:DUF6551 family protein n=1 Tax=Actinomadura litoris TaxID=2678616 RepID=UPI001FA7F08C|nr:DUF6551 family protein [Actinomadura litoris]
MSHALDAPPTTRPGAAYVPREVGELVVSARPHGLYAVVDGNRRAALLRMTHGDMYVVTCQVYEGLTAAQEAELAEALNAPSPASDTNRKPTPLAKFLARRAEGDKAAATITRLAASLGWEISERQTTTNIIAVASLERIYRGGDPASEDTNELAMWQTLYAVTRAWGHKRDAVNGDLLLGVGLALLRQDGRVDLDALIKRLSRVKGGPRALLDNARAARKGIGGCTVAEALAHILTS